MDDSVWVAGCTGPVKAPSAVLHAVVPGRRLRGSRPEGASAKTRRFGRRLVPRPGCGRFGAQGMPGRSGRAGTQDVGHSGRRELRTSGAQDVGPFLRLSRRFDQAEAMITAGPKSTPAMGQMSHETFQALQTKLHKR